MNPYEQPHHYNRARVKTQASGGPSTARTKQRSMRAMEIERVNTILAKKLKAVKREPASRFHAPDGDASLRPKSQRGPKGPGSLVARNGNGPGTSRKREVPKGLKSGAAAAAEVSEENDQAARTWPPPRLKSTRAKEEAQRIKEGNAALRKALEEQYKPGRDSQLVAEGKGRPVDGLEMWKKRLALYDPDAPSSFASSIEKGVCTNTGVPKAMGVARCSATGLYTYYAADGHKLKEHPDCPGLYYCDEWFDDFSAMDALSQKQMIEYAKAKGAGGWMPARAASESWVVNRHMKLGLDMMRRMAKGDDTITMDDVKAAVEEAKEREKVEDAEREKEQKALDKAAAEAALAEAEATGEGGEAEAEGEGAAA